MRPQWFAILLTAILGTTQAFADDHQFENPGTVAANEFVPTALQSGPNHTVSSEARSDGFQNTYTVNSKYGAFEATGLSSLKQTITEVDALAYLEAVSRAEVFVDALGEAGVQTASAIAKVFTSPVTTVQGIPDGIGRVFEGAQRGFGLAKRMFQGKSSKDGVKPEDFREMNYLMGDSQREWAQELKTDPYTTNMKLRQTISGMSVVEFVGGLPVDIALPMGAGLAVGVLGDENEIYKQSAGQLEAKNRACLETLGVAAKDIDTFVSADYLTPTTQTGVCRTLSQLAGVEGASELVNAIALSQSFEGANFLMGIGSMMAAFQDESTDKLTRIVVSEGLPYGMKGEQPVVMLPAENLQWTEPFANRMTAMKTSGTVILPSAPSEMTSNKLAAAGWSLSVLSAAE